MYKSIMICLICMAAALGSCKSNSNDNTANWVGVYTDANKKDTISNIIVTAAGNNLLRIEMKGMSGGYIYTYAVLQHVTVTTGSQCVISESANITTGDAGQYNIQGNINLAGPTITLTAQATQAMDTRSINFAGKKQ